MKNPKEMTTEELEQICRDDVDSDDTLPWEELEPILTELARRHRERKITMQSIKEIRQSTGLSQAKFCEALNIPKRTVQDWEQGLRKCPEYVMELIAYRVANDPSIPKVDEDTEE